MERRKLELTADQRTELEWIRDRDTRPYFREQAAALLKVAGGQSAHHVALYGLHKPRHPDTVYNWINRFEKNGRLIPRPPCRRAFSPS